MWRLPIGQKYGQDPSSPSREKSLRSLNEWICSQSVRFFERESACAGSHRRPDQLDRHLSAEFVVRGTPDISESTATDPFM
jgi:hypothetical protein